MGVFSDLKLKYNTADISIKLIFINVGIFTIVAIYNAIFYSLIANHSSFFEDYFWLPSNLQNLLYKPWSIFTYSFLHFDFSHLLGNIIVLYFTGRIFLNLFSPKLFLNYYILGIFAGGILFLLSYNLLPAFKEIHNALLVGASAAIFSVLTGVTTHVPNYNVHLFGVFSLKLWVITTLLIIGFVAGITGGNPGGEFAHIGGAIAGYLYTLQLKKGNDFVASISTLFKQKKRSPLKTVYKKSNSVKKPDDYQQKIDAILDKINKSGYQALSQEEKDFLFTTGKK